MNYYRYIMQYIFLENTKHINFFSVWDRIERDVKK